MELCNCGNTAEYISKHDCPNVRPAGEHKSAFSHMPYNEIELDGFEYWDYSVKIGGVLYQVSVGPSSKELFIDKDEDQGE